MKVSKFNFSGGSDTSVRESFENKKYYKENAKLENVNFLDTHYQNINYGLLNSSYEPVCLFTDTELTNLTSINSPQNTVYVANFVAAAFDAFKRYYVAETLNSGLQFPPVIGELNPQKGLTNFDQSWKRYVDSISTQYATLILQDMSDIRQYPDLLLSLVKKNIEKYPITKSGFLVSNKCPISVSGLTIELAQLEYGDNEGKNQFFNSAEYVCFAELASEMGFYIDKNVPWRLIANLDSPIMKSHILKYKPDTTPENILDKAYRKKVHYDDLSSLYYFYTTTITKALNSIGLEYTSSPDQIELVEMLLKIRMMETGIEEERFPALKQAVLDTHSMYSSRYPNSPFKPVLGKIGKICAEKIQENYLAKSKMNSYNKSTLKDLN